MIIGCDGIFDKLTNKEVIKSIWSNNSNNIKSKFLNIHEVCGKNIENILNLSMKRKSYDNLTAVFIAFKSYN